MGLRHSRCAAQHQDEFGVLKDCERLHSHALSGGVTSDWRWPCKTVVDGFFGMDLWRVCMAMLTPYVVQKMASEKDNDIAGQL